VADVSQRVSGVTLGVAYALSGRILTLGQCGVGRQRVGWRRPPVPAARIQAITVTPATSRAARWRCTW
jgi:hypothetical protein